MVMSLQCDIVPNMCKFHLSRRQVALAVLGYTVGYSWMPAPLPDLRCRKDTQQRGKKFQLC